METSVGRTTDIFDSKRSPYGDAYTREVWRWVAELRWLPMVQPSIGFLDIVGSLHAQMVVTDWLSQFPRLHIMNLRAPCILSYISSLNPGRSQSVTESVSYWSWTYGLLVFSAISAHSTQEGVSQSLSQFPIDHELTGSLYSQLYQLTQPRKESVSHWVSFLLIMNLRAPCILGYISSLNPGRSQSVTESVYELICTNLGLERLYCW